MSFEFTHFKKGKLKSNLIVIQNSDLNIKKTII